MFLPQPTTRPFGVEDLSGTWLLETFRTMTQNARASHYTVRITLQSDGAFTQHILWKDRTDHQQADGIWKLDGARVVLEGILLEDFDFTSNTGTWRSSSITWWMIDTRDSIALFGSLHGDPDSFQVFRKENEPNKAVEPTPVAVTSCADAHLAPATSAAHL